MQLEATRNELLSLKVSNQVSLWYNLQLRLVCIRVLKPQVSNQVSLWYNLQLRAKYRILGVLCLVKKRNFSTHKKIAKNGKFVEKYAKI